ncbi:MAG: DUF6134 family protein [Bacteroidota bacterium]
MRNLRKIITQWKPLTIAALFLVLLLPAMAQQERMYDVIRKGDNVGTLKASVSNTPLGQFYYIESKVKVWVVINIKINYNQTNLFKDGLLQRAAMIRTVNGSTKVSNNIMHSPKGYVCMRMDGDTVMVKDEIRHTIAKLYFTEPLNITRVYSENFLSFLAIKSTGPHTYELTLADGKKNYYTYVNGLCTKVQAETDHGTVYLVAR